MDLSDHLLSLEQRLLLPSVRSDAAELRSLLAPDFLEIGSSGRAFNRDQIIAELAREQNFIAPTLSHLQIVAHSGSWALITYRTTRLNASGLQSVTLRSSTWIHHEGRWHLLFHQGTPASSQP